MSDQKIQISWEELKTAKVEKHIRQQQAMLRNRRYSQLKPQDLPSPHVPKGSIWYNSIFCLTIFGLLGGLLAWGSVALLHLRPDQRHQADQALSYIEDIRKTIRTSLNSDGISPQQAQAAIKNIALDAGDNPYLSIDLDDSLSPRQKQQRLDDLARADQWRDLMSHILGLGICGMFISVFLSIAEPVIDRNFSAAVVNGSVGAALGLVGGLAASLVVDRVYTLIVGANHGQLRQYLAWASSYAVLGCFLAVAPGVVAKNAKRLVIGLAGGIIGGAVGGLLLDPISQATGNVELGRLAAMASIGLITGAATGIIERAARAGWLKVTAGLIAGKQFILYRNPTYIGSAPDCQIYIFKDPQVGRRHAAVHLQKGRIEIEDLPLGAATIVNGTPIARRRLRDGDQIRIGGTSFLFQERNRED
jgi:hypothetical protein